MFNPDAETQVDAVDSQQTQQNAEKGAKTAENVRYGQAISENGMGGMTTQAKGSANQGTLIGVVQTLTPSLIHTCRLWIWGYRGAGGKQ